MAPIQTELAINTHIMVADMHRCSWPTLFGECDLQSAKLRVFTVP